MKYLELRRHSIRQKSGNNLSQDGVNLARRIGESMTGNYKHVYTSTKPRAIQTAVAMGFAITESTDIFASDSRVSQELSNYPHWDDINSLTAALDIEIVNKYANDQLNIYRALLDKIDDGESILIISHGGLLEIPLLAMFPDTTMGDLFSFCEGYRVKFREGEFLELTLLSGSN